MIEKYLTVIVSDQFKMILEKIGENVPLKEEEEVQVLFVGKLKNIYEKIVRLAVQIKGLGKELNIKIKTGEVVLSYSLSLFFLPIYLYHSH